MPDFSHEIRFGRLEGKVICGVDEVGRGPLAGPVVAAAAFLPQDFPDALCREIKDSKKMSARAREDIYGDLIANCHYAIAEASVAEIDTLNILWASMLAMERAVGLLNHNLNSQNAHSQSRLRTPLPNPPRKGEGISLSTTFTPHNPTLIEIALIDGNRAPKLTCAAFPIVKGDDKSLSIAAASIIAKVHRDRMMKKLAEEFPHYGWERNAGYGTAAHLAALTQHGITVWHRSSFAPVRSAREAI